MKEKKREKNSASANSRIEAELARNPAGLGLDALHSALNASTANSISRRTLQRRVSELAAQKTIGTTGNGRGLRYHARQTDATPKAEPLRAEQPRARYEVGAAKSVHNNTNAGVNADATKAADPITAAYVPVSPEGQAVLDYIRQPIQRRTPVGYDSSLLETYRPNETFYLSEEIRQHLHNIGRSPANERPAGTYARDILGRLLIDLSWASSRLEGNTYTRLDTQNLIELGETATGHDRREAQMILNHKAAIEMLVDGMQAGVNQADGAQDIGFNPFTFFNLHSLLSDGLLSDPSESGRLRRRIVDISGTVFYPLGIPQQIEPCFRMILDKASAIADPFEQAFFVMVQIPYLQPFIDVNKRVSRLGANIPLIRHNLCPLSFVDVPERAYVEGTLGVYELGNTDLLRDVFVWAYERSCGRYLVIRAAAADPDPMRMRYREAIVSVVTQIVRGLQAPGAGAVRALAAPLVPPDDLERVVAMALEDLRNLHEGSVARFRLRLVEYRAWRAQEQS